MIQLVLEEPIRSIYESFKIKIMLQNLEKYRIENQEIILGGYALVTEPDCIVNQEN